MKKIFGLVFLILLFLMFLLSKNSVDDKRVVIKFSSWGSQSEISYLLPLIAEFEQKNPDIKVEFVHIPQNYFQKLHLLYASNLAPDVVFINNYYLPKYVKANLLEDLTPYIKKDEFFQKSVDCFTFDKKIYAIPRDVSNLVVYYNKNLFDTYRIPYPSRDWTIDDLINISKRFKTESKGEVFGLSYETDLLYVMPFLFSNGASVLSDDGKKMTITEKNAIDTINLYSDLANKYNIAPKKSQSASRTMAQMFLQQKIAMQVSGRWLVPKYRQEAKFDWDIMSFPSGQKGSIVNIDASGYALSKSSKHKAEALKFIEFISSPYSLSKLAQSGLIVPARKQVAYSPAFLDSQLPPKSASIFLESIQTGKATPVNENYQVITDELNRQLESVFLGKKIMQKNNPTFTSGDG